MAKWALILVLGASVLWSGWWVLGARGIDAAVSEGLTQMEFQGWDIAHDDLSVQGFPNRFDVTLSEPRIATPDGWTLDAPFLQAFALSYRPNHVILVAPPEMMLSHPLAGEIDITSGDLRASVILTASSLDRATLTADTLAIGGLGGLVTVTQGQVATRQAGGPTRYDLAVTLEDVGAPGLAAPIDTLDLDALITLDRALGPGDPARLDSLEIRSARLAWDEVTAELSGEMSVMFDGTPRGDFALRLTEWEAFLQSAVDAGIIPAGQAPLVAAGLRGLEDDQGQATVPLAVEDGFFLVLGFPVAQVPRLPVPGR